MKLDTHLARMNTTVTPLPRLVFDQQPIATPEVDAICQRGIDAALSYIASRRPGRARFVLTRTEMQARRRHLEVQTESLEFDRLVAEGFADGTDTDTDMGSGVAL